MSERRSEEFIYELAKKWQKGTITEEERELFNQWYHSFRDSNASSHPNDSSDLQDRLYLAITDREKIFSDEKIRRMNRRYFISIAAVLLILLSFTTYFLTYKKLSKESSPIAGTKKEVISPGGNKAVLTLADGKTILLDSAANGLLASEGDISIRKDKEGQLVYEVKANRHGRGATDGDSRSAYNIISTPRGGQYQIDLPDGTRVWLNAASSLKFPTAFNGRERKVELDGEAYFEVAKVSGKEASGPSPHIPFIVASSRQEVKVLGTHFNISAYKDEDVVKTTLLEGSVEVTQLQSGRFQRLRPGQQARVTDDILVNNIDPDQEIAWKNGYFVFDNEDVESIMRKISRWYNVEVDYQGNIQSKKFAGTISKFKDVSEVLGLMELTKKIHFKIQERRIVVMP